MLEKLLEQAQQIVADGDANVLSGAAHQVVEKMTINQCAEALADTEKAALWARRIAEGTLHINYFHNGVATAIMTLDKMTLDKRNLPPTRLVTCDCGHAVPSAQVMSASSGSSCPDCYDRMSD